MAQHKTKGKASAIDIIIGQKLRQKRIEHKMSQEDLGRAIGVTFQQIQKYENGMNRVSASRLFLAAYALDHEVSDFFTDLEGKGFAEILQRPDKYDNFQDAIDAFEKIEKTSTKSKIEKLTKRK